MIERQDMVVEAVKMMRMLWGSDEPVTCRGNFYSLDCALLYTKPADRVPVYLP